MSDAWKNRIVGYDEVPPDTLTLNPMNWRRHPDIQSASLLEVLERIGWAAGPVIVNRTTGHVVDGHLRVELARRRGVPTVPVQYVELTPEEELAVLATIDPIAALAEADDAVLGALLTELNEADADLAQLAAAVHDADAAVFASLGDEMEMGEDGLARSAFENKATGALVERFGAPPFSVLDGRAGYWQYRKHRWLSLGIDPGAGREYLRKTVVAEGTKWDLGRKNHGGSSFDPVLAELMYVWFCPPNGAVLDPFAGGSVRGIVAAVLGRHYVGIDLRPEQVAANREQASRMTFPAKPPEWLIGDSREVIPTLDRECDFVFSCPPYADLERYSDDPRDLSAMEYEDFVEAYRDIIAQAVGALRDDRFAVFVVGDARDRHGYYRGLVAETIRAFEDAGAHLYNTAIYLQPIGSAKFTAKRPFQTSRKLMRAHQEVLVFVKGGPKRAATACGDVSASLERLAEMGLEPVRAEDGRGGEA